jgi:hypothetical protein
MIVLAAILSPACGGGRRHDRGADRAGSSKPITAACAGDHPGAVLGGAAFGVRPALRPSPFRRRNGKGWHLFPGEPASTYLDFVYLAFSIGATFQVSDNNVLTAKLRNLVTAQAVCAYFYNTAILALGINIIASVWWASAGLRLAARFVARAFQAFAPGSGSAAVRPGAGRRPCPCRAGRSGPWRPWRLGLGDAAVEVAVGRHDRLGLGEQAVGRGALQHAAHRAAAAAATAAAARLATPAAGTAAPAATAVTAGRSATTARRLRRSEALQDLGRDLLLVGRDLEAVDDAVTVAVQHREEAQAASATNSSRVRAPSWSASAPANQAATG